MHIRNIPRVPRLGRKAMAALAITAASTGLLAGATSSAFAAQANGNTTLVASSSWLDVAVSGGSTAIGAPIIQWYADGGGEQQWNIPPAGQSGNIVNVNSGMCVTTDGIAGDGLFQEPCSPVGQGWYNNQQWVADAEYGGPTLFLNPSSNLVMDVYGYSFGAGATIDAWYPNYAPNQYFWNSTDY